MKVLEHDVARLKTGKSVESAADHGPEVIPDLPLYPCIGSHHGGPVAKGHDKRKQVGNHLLRERNGQPEEGTAPQIKRKASAHAAAQVDIGIPEKAAASDRSVGQNIKRHLLHIVIPVIEEDPAVINQKGKDRCQIQQRSSHEQQYIA